jgi:uncharacterized protein YyaL (SSP411 family)
MPPERKKPNRLIYEKSPYLQQHAYNPVDWYPWSREAFDRAKTEDKPLFVSIGYSTCHWCHVMEKESFEDDQVAKALNEVFVCVKVDREERPDLDAAYMEVCQAMGRSCGWPLNVIMTPNKNPFFVASYIPKDDRYGTVGLLNLAPQIGQIWKTRKEEMENIGRDVKEQIANQLKPAQKETLDNSVFDDAYEQLFLRFDPEFGGFGRAPKFPSPHNLLFLLRYYNRTKEQKALDMVEKTLRFMRLGGIFDQVGLGFHRYSTDAQWLVPHFEKMLYDQAWLTLAYIEVYQATGAAKFKITAKETLDYVLRDLVTPDGGFYSAEDADSEGEEGKFYVWTIEEVKESLSPQDAELAVKIFDIKPEGNYYEPPKGRNGKNILHFAKPIQELSQENNLTMDQFIAKLGKIVSTLFQVREKRIRPSKDDKVLVDWNGSMIAALSRAGQIFGDAKYVGAAKKAADFLLKEMWTQNGKLYHRYAKGEKAVMGFLDDYANLALGVIELYEATFDETYLKAAVDLTKTMVTEFWDKENGGFFFTDTNAEETIPRLKQTYDGAAPSGNSIALLNLLRLARLSGDNSFEEYASKLIAAFSQEIKTQPLGHTYMLSGLDFALGPNYNVVLVGESKVEKTKSLQEALRKKYSPNLTVTLRKPEPSVISGYEELEGKPTAYVCRNQTCMPPTNSIEKMLQYLDL